MIKKATYIYHGFERFWHWSQALLIFFLALTGFEIHGTFTIFGFENVVRWHNTAAWAFLVLIVFAIFWHFVTGEWKQYIPTTKFIRAQIGYYVTGIFKGAPHPTHKTIYNKFNPLQRLVYLGLKLLVIPVQVITGIVYMTYVYPTGSLQLGALGPVAIIHTIGAFFLMAFVVAHVYLTTTGETPLSSLKAMITGWEELHTDEKENRRENLSKAVDQSAAGYYRLDAAGYITDVNKAWLSLYKYDHQDEVVGKHFSVTRTPEEMSRLENFFNNIMQGESVTGEIVTRKCKDGSRGHHVLTANPIRENNQIVGMEGFIVEIISGEYTVK